MTNDVPEPAKSAALSAADRDGAGVRRDAAADVRDLAAGRRDLAGNERDRLGDGRDDAARTRDEEGDVRDEAAQRRDLGARQRDVEALRRDRAADERDRLARDDSPGESGPRAEADRDTARRYAADDRDEAARDRKAGVAERGEAEQDRRTATSDRGRGAAERVDAGADRDSALSDRGSGAAERGHSARDRSTALIDRDLSADDLARASLDGLTGVYTRAAGTLELQREVDRALRTRQPLVLMFVDVDGLKAVNDKSGHAAGDRVLVRVAQSLRAILRPYDLVIRYGGDEFVCALAGGSLHNAALRLRSLDEMLAAHSEPISVTAGLGELRPGDTLSSLVGRADDDLYRQRRAPRTRP